MKPSANAYGYYNMALNIKKQLEAKGIELDDSCQTELTIGSACDFEAEFEGNWNQWLFTMWEGNRLPHDYVAKANHAYRVIVPCKHNAKAFKDSGVEVPIEVCPLGYDDEAIKYERKVHFSGQVFRFLWIGAPHLRKGYELLARAFAMAFKPYEPVELYMKTTGALNMPEMLWRPWPRVAIDNRNLPFSEIVALYHSAHSFVFPSRGEGFGLPALEAMAAGCLLIAPKSQGLADFVDRDVAFILDCPLKPTIFEEVPRAPTINPKELALAMRKAYEQYPKTLLLREQGAARAKIYTWSNSVGKLISILFGGNEN